MSPAFLFALSTTVFFIGIFGILLNRRNLILMLMAIELILLAVNFNLIVFSRILGDSVGQIMVFFIMTVAAVESAIGLAILILLFKKLKSVAISDVGKLKG
jgi:NADH-quinone oxidoreductase subunit K|tara:strand:+ start:24 stop:326 length:303 start_codon:yes stop_codon:yes gene_type:complete